jgi:hypothetical protein
MKSKIIELENRIHPWIWQIIGLVVSILVFSFILENRSPNLLRPVSVALRTGFGVTILFATLTVYAAFRLPERLGESLALTATMSLFALGLAGLWASGNTQSVALNGLIPLYDASGYYIDAIRLQYGLDVSSFTAMRPFFAGLLSLFLRFSENNLMTALAVFTAIAGYSCYLACTEIKRTHGAEVAVFVLMLMFLYYRHHSGTTMSETLGVAVSLLGIALLWRGIADQKQASALFGVGMISLALNIRPGAMFVLPALLLWGGWTFRGQGKFSIKFFGLGVAFILLTFYANSRMVDFVSSSSGAAFENFAWAFYGLASGGNSWTYVFEANPQLSLLPEAEVTPTIYRLAFDLILTQPWLIIKGAFFYWSMFFSNTWYNAYAFVAGDDYWVNEVTRWGMYILGGLGIFKWSRNRVDPYTSLAVIGALGVLASVPFVPPTDAYRVRLYAATIPFFVLLPAMGLSYLLEKIPVRFFKPSLPSLPEEYPTAAFSIALIIVLITAPILLKTTGRLPALPKTACPPEMDSFFTRFDTGTYINLHRENKAFLDWMPDFHISVFRRNAHDLPDSKLISIMEHIDPSNSLFYALDLQTNHEAIIIVETDLLPEPGTLIQLCGKLNPDPETPPYMLFFADEVLLLQGQ